MHEEEILLDSIDSMGVSVKELSEDIVKDMKDDFNRFDQDGYGLG